MKQQGMTLDVLLDAVKDLKNAAATPIRQEISKNIWAELLKATTVHEVKDVPYSIMGMPVLENPFLPDNCAMMIYQDGKREVVNLKTGHKFELPNYYGQLKGEDNAG